MAKQVTRSGHFRPVDKKVYVRIFYICLGWPDRRNRTKNDFAYISNTLEINQVFGMLFATIFLSGKNCPDNSQKEIQMKISTLAAATTFALAAMSPAMAVPIPNGTVSTADQFVPTINTATAPATYSVTMGGTVNTIGTGGFTNVTGRSGIENGTLQFASTVGATIAQTVGSFFTFNSPTQTYTFSVASVRTDTYSVTPQNSAMALFLLGSTTSSGFDVTPTSLTLNFNSTGGSPFAVSQTLAIPPAGGTPVPEPVSVAILGISLVGLGLLRRRA